MIEHNWLYPTAFKSWGSEERDAIARVIASDKFTMGDEVEAFETELAAYHDRTYAICCNSGSSANLLAVVATLDRIDPIRAISLPAIAWSTTYAPFLQFGLLQQMRIADVDNTWNAIHENSANAKTVITCPVLGNAARRPDALWLIEDACESSGARDSHGRLAGAPGPLISTGSGFWSHQISCIEMGWIMTDDRSIAMRVRLLRNHGNQGWLPGQAEIASWEDRYRFSLAGYNLRPTELHAAIGREQLKKLDEGNVARRRNLISFATQAAGLPIRMQQLQGTPAPFGIAFEVSDRARRGALAAAFAAAGIDSRPPTGGSATRHPYMASFRQANPTPRADRVHDTGIFLGNASVDLSAQIELALRVMRAVL